MSGTDWALRKGYFISSHAREDDEGEEERCSYGTPRYVPRARAVMTWRIPQRGIVCKTSSGGGVFRTFSVGVDSLLSRESPVICTVFSSPLSWRAQRCYKLKAVCEA